MMRKKYTFFKTGATVFLSVLIVSFAVYASTTVGNNVSVGGTLGVTGTTTFSGIVNIGTVAINGTYFDVATTTGAVTLTQQAVGTSPLTITGIDSSTSSIVDLNVTADGGSIIDVDWATATQTAALTGLDIDLSNLTTDGTNALYGIHVNDQVGNTTSTEYGIYVEGSNWDQGLYVVDAVKFDGAVTITEGALTDSTILSADIKDGEIVNADVNSSAAIAGTKISPDFGSQNVVTTGTLGAATTTISSGPLSLGGGSDITKLLFGSVSINPPSIATSTTGSATTTVSGATTDMKCFVQPPATLNDDLTPKGCQISATGVIKVYLYAENAPIDDATTTWGYLLIK